MAKKKNGFQPAKTVYNKKNLTRQSSSKYLNGGSYQGLRQQVRQSAQERLRALTSTIGNGRGNLELRKQRMKLIQSLKAEVKTGGNKQARREYDARRYKQLQGTAGCPH